MTTDFVSSLWVRELTPYAAVPIGLSFFVPFILDRHPGNQIRSMGFFKRWCLYFVVFGSFMFFSFFAIGSGIPALINILVGREQSMVVVVSEKSSGTWSRRDCRYKLVVNDQLTYSDNDRCVAEAFWMRTAIGDTLRATIRHSSFGQKVTELSN